MNDIFSAWTQVIDPNVIYVIFAWFIIHAMFSVIFDKFHTS